MQTDTASVLLEAMEYIRFLHEQVKVCHSVFLCCCLSIIVCVAAKCECAMLIELAGL